jgi:hypothetical protein
LPRAVVDRGVLMPWRCTSALARCRIFTRASARSSSHASICYPTAGFRLPIEKRARLEGLSLVYCHSHPAQQGTPAFSTIDDETEIPLARYASGRVPKVPHISLVIGAEGFRARVLGTAEAVEISEIGRAVTRHGMSAYTPVNLVHDRQVRAFGEEGQRAIRAMRIAIVGLGGTGSVVAEQLAYLGVHQFLLIDPDVVDETSLNRLVGATRRDLGRPKVLVGRRFIRRVTPEAQVRAVRGDILERKVGLLLTDVDFVFCCTDTHGSRHVVNQLAYQYFVPCIDMGVVINVQEGKVTHFDGRVQMLAPGLWLPRVPGRHPRRTISAGIWVAKRNAALIPTSTLRWASSSRR